MSEQEAVSPLKTIEPRRLAKREPPPPKKGPRKPLPEELARDPIAHREDLGTPMAEILEAAPRGKA